MTSYESLSDLELIALLKQSDHHAFKEIFDRYDKLLFLFTYRKLKEREEAKDLVQDIFSWIWKNRMKLPDSVPLSSYLYKSALNKIFDVFRHQNTVQLWINRGDHYLDQANEATDYLIREKDIKAIIDREIAGMPPRMREIYELKRLHDLSVKEIAAQLGLSEHTISTQLKRALKHLRIKLDPLIYLLFVLH